MVRSRLNCMQCRYDLRATAIDGCCPECGTPEADTIEAEKRKYDDSAHWRAVTVPVLVIQGLGTLLNVLVFAVSTDSRSGYELAQQFCAQWLVVTAVWLVVTISLVFGGGSSKAKWIALGSFVAAATAMLINGILFVQIISGV